MIRFLAFIASMVLPVALGLFAFCWVPKSKRRYPPRTVTPDGVQPTHGGQKNG